MHLPDGFLDTRTAVVSTGMAVAGVGIALRQVRATLEPRRMPLLGLAAAFIFAAQMLNFPVMGGTSGHLVGGVLTAILLGPSAAIVVMTCVLLVQCLMFADGGLMALGANVFNMGLVSVCSGWLVFRLAKPLVRADSQRSTIFAAGFAGWVGTVLPSVSCAGQLAFSGTAPWPIALPAMANVHMLIGIGEGLATALVVAAILRTRPELLAGAGQPGAAPRSGFFAYGLVLSAGLAVFVAPFACPWPDGLESVAKRLGFEHQAVLSPIHPPMSDYHLPLVGSAVGATALAGLIGTVLAFVAAYALARVLVPALRAPQKNASAGG